MSLRLVTGSASWVKKQLILYINTQKYIHVLYYIILYVMNKTLCRTVMGKSSTVEWCDEVESMLSP